ncbi:NADAR family protein [Hazenella coriacea]|nr:NADAR family protein [Hazenella coriacea]
MRETDQFIFFWGNNDIYSNFYYSPFKHQGRMFQWSEQAIMYRKAKLFGADQIAEKILMASTPKECKALGRSREIPFSESVWKEHRELVYREVLLDKFSLPSLKMQIIATREKHLVEASPFDRIWGIGMGENDPDVEDPTKWRGLNLLGKVLMEVRDLIQS